MDDLAVKVEGIDQRCKSNTHRLDRLEGIAEAIHEQNSSIKELVNEIKHTNEHVTDNEDRIASLERQPGERWNSMTRTIFTAVVSALAGGLVAVLTGLVK